MYCTFTTCMYVYMLMYMSAYICVCMHVYVIYVSEGLRKMWDFKQTQKQNSDFKITVTKHISKGRRGTQTTESWRRSSRLSRLSYSFSLIAAPLLPGLCAAGCAGFRKLFERHKVRSQREISPQLIKKKKEASERLHAGVRNTASGRAQWAPRAAVFLKPRRWPQNMSRPLLRRAEPKNCATVFSRCFVALHQMHQQSEWNGAKHDITTSFSPLGCLFSLASSPLQWFSAATNATLS